VGQLGHDMEFKANSPRNEEGALFLPTPTKVENLPEMIDQVS
jgi:hypothetical protein